MSLTFVIDTLKSTIPRDKGKDFFNELNKQVINRFGKDANLASIKSVEAEGILDWVEDNIKNYPEIFTFKKK